MKMERIDLPALDLPRAYTREGGQAARWRTAAALALAVGAWLLAWYWQTVLDMVHTWNVNATYTHGFLVMPVTAWLVWRKRQALAQLTPEPNLRVLPLLLLPGCAWLLGELANVKVVQEYALASMPLLVAWTLLGNRVARVLAFPLAFLAFAVPFGEFLVPPLMDQTANFTVTALRLTGIPVYREGLYFSVPRGNWSVVEACSGLRYLIASLTGGVLYAYLRYRSFKRRAIFVAVAAAVPVVANWVRAYLIVVLDQVSGGRLAMDVDHLLYGWVFFGIVTLLLFWIASSWREDGEDFNPVARPAHRTAKAAPVAAFAAAALAVAIAVAAWPALAAWLDRTTPSGEIALAVPAHAGAWQQAPERITSWEPHLLEPAAAIEQTYADGPRRATLRVAYYVNQRRGADVASSLNALVTDNGEWRLLEQRDRTARLPHADLRVHEAQLQGQGRLLVWRWYWVDGIYTASPYWAKLVQIRAQLLGRPDDAAIVLLYAPYDGSRPDAARRDLTDLAAGLEPAITRSLFHAH